MIKSKSDLKFYLAEDKKQLKRNSPVYTIFYKDFVWGFQILLRYIEYYKNTGSNKLLLVFLQIIFKYVSLLMGFSIPTNVFGPGLSIAHYGTIIVNMGAKVGSNCRLHPGTCIGTAAGESDSAPQIGDNVYIGPGAKLFGPIVIGSNKAIGANAVVTKSFPSDGGKLLGVPAKESY